MSVRHVAHIVERKSGSHRERETVVARMIEMLDGSRQAGGGGVRGWIRRFL